jgi:dienelactone hydrolase
MAGRMEPPAARVLADASAPQRHHARPCEASRPGRRRQRFARVPVTSEVVSDETTQDIYVFAPQAQGTWPVVVALHGIGGSGHDMGELATRLARAGTVVFAPTYRSDLTTADGLNQAASDIACGYRFARTTSPQHGVDLSQPVTAVGWSLGADFVVVGGLQPATGPSPNDPCPGDKAPDIIVGISGCYYEYEGKPINWFDDVSSLGNKNSDIYLLAGDQDTTCPAWQSQKLASALRARATTSTSSSSPARTTTPRSSTKCTTANSR